MNTILIIEDDPVLCKNMAIILKMEGYEILTASNGMEGLAMIHKNKPDLILCDILMPEIDGYAFYHKIRKENFTDIPFIFISALNEYEQLRKGMQMGADDYLAKPFSAEQLVNSVSIRLQRFDSIRNSHENRQFSANQKTVLGQLSNREKQILQMVAEGLTSRQIADKLCISPKTVEAHRYKLKKKLCATNAASLALWAGIIPGDGKTDIHDDDYNDS